MGVGVKYSQCLRKNWLSPAMFIAKLSHKGLWGVKERRGQNQISVQQKEKFVHQSRTESKEITNNGPLFSFWLFSVQMSLKAALKVSIACCKSAKP